MNWLFTVAYVLLGISLAGVFWTLLLATSSLTTAEVPINFPQSSLAFESGKYSMPLPCPSCISTLLRHHCGARRWLHSRGHRCHPDKQLATQDCSASEWNVYYPLQSLTTVTVLMHHARYPWMPSLKPGVSEYLAQDLLPLTS